MHRGNLTWSETALNSEAYKGLNPHSFQLLMHMMENPESGNKANLHSLVWAYFAIYHTWKLIRVYIFIIYGSNNMGVNIFTQDTAAFLLLLI